MKRSVCIYGMPVLREPGRRIEEIDDAVRTLAQDMIETMHAARGIGLAAQQVGERLLLCVVDLPAEMDVDDEGARGHPGAHMPMVLINPEIIASSDDTSVLEEGCLSFPDITGAVERPWEVTVRYQDLDGAAREETYQGMLARVLQHEIDHLNGVLFIDRMSYIKKMALKGRLKRLRAETLEGLSKA